MTVCLALHRIVPTRFRASCRLADTPVHTSAHAALRSSQWLAHMLYAHHLFSSQRYCPVILELHLVFALCPGSEYVPLRLSALAWHGMAWHARWIPDSAPAAFCNCWRHGRKPTHRPAALRLRIKIAGQSNTPFIGYTWSPVWGLPFS